MIAYFPEFEPLQLPNLDFEPLSLDFEAVMFELEPLPQIELPEFEPFEFEPSDLSSLESYLSQHQICHCTYGQH